MSSSSPSPPPTSTTPLSSTSTSPTQITNFETFFSVEGESIPHNLRCKNVFCPSKTNHYGGPLRLNATDPSQFSYPPPPSEYWDQKSETVPAIPNKATLAKLSPPEQKRRIKEATEAQKRVAEWRRNFLYAHGKPAAQRVEDEKRAEKRRQEKKNAEEQKAAAAVKKAISNSKNGAGNAEKPESVTKQLHPTPRHRPYANHSQQSSFARVKFAAQPSDSSGSPVPSGIKEVRHFTHPIFQRRNSSPPDGPEPRGWSMNVAAAHGNIGSQKTCQPQKNKAASPATPEFRGPRRERKGHIIIGHASPMATSRSI
ncbi:MAG: hypothetical protein Q9214_001736 [Letrouitia sp. 1 TL-2023]